MNQRRWEVIRVPKGLTIDGSLKPNWAAGMREIREEREKGWGEWCPPDGTLWDLPMVRGTVGSWEEVREQNASQEDAHAQNIRSSPREPTFRSWKHRMVNSLACEGRRASGLQRRAPHTSYHQHGGDLLRRSSSPLARHVCLLEPLSLYKKIKNIFYNWVSIKINIIQAGFVVTESLSLYAFFLLILNWN